MQSRYYNPEWGRFLNADGVTGVFGELLSHNMFVYCNNNPVNAVDPDGEHWYFLWIDNIIDWAFKLGWHDKETTQKQAVAIETMITTQDPSSLSPVVNGAVIGSQEMVLFLEDYCKKYQALLDAGYTPEELEEMGLDDKRYLLKKYNDTKDK